MPAPGWWNNWQRRGSMKIMIQFPSLEPTLAEVKFVNQRPSGAVELTAFEAGVPIDVLLDSELLAHLGSLAASPRDPAALACEESEQRAWAFAKETEAPGHFLKNFLYAMLHADGENFELLRPVVRVLMEKYPARS
jgi:hypothetical protein